MSHDNLKVRKLRPADYIFWLRKDDWLPTEASILLAGYEPEAFTDGDINFSSLAGDADGIHRLIIESINAKKISVNNPPSQWIAWATQEGMTLPAELMAALPSQTGPDATATPAPLATAGAPGGVEPVKAGPLSLTTSDIAFCFAGLGWNEKEWKRPLGDKPKWLVPCIAIPGARGVRETRWNPVLIGAALVHNKHVTVNSVRARFQTRPLLKPWIDEWKTYEADNLDTE